MVGQMQPLQEALKLQGWRISKLLLRRALASDAFQGRVRQEQPVQRQQQPSKVSRSAPQQQGVSASVAMTHGLQW